MNLKKTEILRLWDWFQYAVESNQGDELAESRFANLLRISPRFQSGNIAFYTPMDMVEAGFTEMMAYKHVNDLAMNFSSGQKIAELCSAIKDVRQFNQVTYDLLKDFGLTATFEKMTTIFQQIVSESQDSFDEFTKKQGGNKRQSPTVFIFFKLHNQEDIHKLTSGETTIQSYRDYWKPLYQSSTLQELQAAMVNQFRDDIEGLILRIEGESIGDEWLTKRLNQMKNITLDRNLSHRIVQLNQIWKELQQDCKEYCDKEKIPVLADKYLLEGLLQVLPSELLELEDMSSLDWLREQLSGTEESQGLLGDMARIREMVRDVIESPNDSVSFAEHIVFLKWLVEQQSKVDDLLKTKPPNTKNIANERAILLTWNPDKWNDWDYEALVKQTERGIEIDDDWTVGKKNIGIGTKVFLVIQNFRNGIGGVVGMGTTTGEVFFQEKYQKLSVPVRWSRFLPIEQHITYKELESIAPKTYFKTQRSGYVAMKTKIEEEAVSQRIDEKIQASEKNQNKTKQQDLILISASYILALQGNKNPEKAVLLDFIETNQLFIPDENDEKVLETRNEVTWRNAFAFRRNSLKEEGILRGNIRGCWGLTDAGIKYIKEFDWKEVDASWNYTNKKALVEFLNTSKELKLLSFTDIINHLEANPSELVIDKKKLRSIHNGLHANQDKRFIILSGLSGTGKTRWLQEYFKAYCELLELDPKEQIKLIAITPAFRDHTPLLGYLNPLTETPVYVEGALTKFLVEAHQNPDVPFFLILDEMNLARVEYYLAPLLSAMEAEDTEIVFYDGQNVAFKDGKVIPSRIPSWPSNLFMAGTVNMDETTHAFSDKVLDRAFTMEFWDIELTNFLDKLEVEGKFRETIIKVYNALQPAHLHFGYRTVKAIVDYVRTDPKDEKGALDQAIFSKVLPKLRGQKNKELSQALLDLKTACSLLSEKDQNDKETSQTLLKIEQMEKRLGDTGLTRFWR